MPALTRFDSRCRLLTLLLVLCAPTAVLGQDVTEVRLKSAFIYNFVKFTQWPADALPAGAMITACVVGDPAVGEALVRTVMGRLLDGRGITVSIVRPDSLLPTCHVLYVSGSADKRAAEIVLAMRTIPVLTISDLSEFARKGGVVQLSPEAGKMRFSVNLRAARRARLQLSSRLLALAELVEEQP
ncbi:MAG TPA: YfiR family protein [Vicinamibacterales bacterium]|nr:YfiR family protein [Vicinamibacterales bacterium]